MAPAQSVGFEAEGAHRGRRHGKRVEGAEPVVDEAGLGQLAAADGTPGLGLRLEHQHTPAVVGQAVGGDEPVRPGPDHDGVEIPIRLA